MRAEYESSLSVGRFTASQVDVYIRPLRQRAHLPPVIYLHGAGNNASQAVGTGLVGPQRLLMALVDLGFPVAAPSTGENYGNATADSRIGDALTWARANLPCSPSAAPVVVAASRGVLDGLDYAVDHSVAALIGLIPLIDLQDVVVNNTLSLRGPANAAWSRTAGDTSTLPAGANPAVQTAALSAVPQQFWYASDDAVSNNISTYASAVGADLNSVGALGHTDAAMLAADVTEAQHFIYDLVA